MSAAGCEGVIVIHEMGVVEVGLQGVERGEDGLHMEMVRSSHGDRAKGLMLSCLLLGAKGAVKMS
jgi:hypothetical protein